MTNKIPHLKIESGGMVLNVFVVNSSQFNPTSFQFITISFLLLSFTSFKAYLALKNTDRENTQRKEYWNTFVLFSDPSSFMNSAVVSLHNGPHSRYVCYWDAGNKVFE